MSIFANLLPFTKKTDAEVEAAVAKINAKAAADVAALRKSSVDAKAKADKAAKVAAFRAALADYQGRLDADRIPSPTLPTPSA